MGGYFGGFLKGKNDDDVDVFSLQFLQDCSDVMQLLLKHQTSPDELADDDPQVIFESSAARTPVGCLQLIHSEKAKEALKSNFAWNFQQRYCRCKKVIQTCSCFCILLIMLHNTYTYKQVKEYLCCSFPTLSLPGPECVKSWGRTSSSICLLLWDLFLKRHHSNQKSRCWTVSEYNTVQIRF